jgi:uncharacterized membrane protein
MSDMNNPTNPSMPTSSPAISVDQKEIDDGKVLAALCYIPILFVGLICSIIMLVMRNNSFSLHHAKQALTLFIVFFILAIPMWILMFIIMMIGGGMGASGNGAASAGGGIIACFGPLLWLAFALTGLVLCILGLVNALQGKMKPLPIIGGFANKIFGSIQKKTA